MIGNDICVYGYVVNLSSSVEISTRLEFSDQKNTFFMYSGKYELETDKGLSLGDCIYSIGIIGKNSGVFNMDLDNGEFLYRCEPWMESGNTNINTPTFEILEVERDIDRTIEVLNSSEWDILSELTIRPYIYLETPSKNSYHANYFNRKPLYLYGSWCAVDRTTLEDNSAHYSYSITINGYEIPSNEFHALESEIPKGEDEYYSDGLMCYEWGILTSNWPIGSHKIINTFTLDKEIFDGYDTYPAGDYIDDFTLVVE